MATISTLFGIARTLRATTWVREPIPALLTVERSFSDRPTSSYSGGFFFRLSAVSVLPTSAVSCRTIFEQLEANSAAAFQRLIDIGRERGIA